MITLSPGLITPRATRALTPAILAALAGSQPTPLASMTDFASMIASSLTAATTPLVNRIAATPRSHDAGSPMRIAVAIVSARTRCRFAKSSANAWANGAAPLA